jgi:hypothetical protein
LSSTPNSYFFEENAVVYFGDSSLRGSAYAFENAEPKSFVILQNADGILAVVAKDKDHVYVGEGTITNADPATFVPLTDSAGNWNGFEIDKSHVYFGSYVIIGADPKTFIWLGIIASNELEAGRYAKDSKRVYFIDRGLDPPASVEGADASTFQLVDVGNKRNDVFLEQSCGQNCYYDAQDAYHKYYLGTIVQ